MPQLRNSACVGRRSRGSQTTSARRCSSVTTCARRLVPPKTRRRTADSEPKETTLTNASLTPKGPEYYDSLIQESVNDSKTLWSSLKSMLPKKATTVTQSVITADGAETKEPLEVANAFNSFFTSVGATLAKKFQDVPRTISTRSENRFKFQPVSAEAVCKQLRGLKTALSVFQPGSSKWQPGNWPCLLQLYSTNLFLQAPSRLSGNRLE